MLQKGYPAREKRRERKKKKKKGPLSSNLPAKGQSAVAKQD